MRTLLVVLVILTFGLGESAWAGDASFDQLAAKSTGDTLAPIDQPQRTRKAWLFGMGLGYGSNNRTAINDDNGYFSSSTLAIGFDASLGRGLTENLLLIGAVTHRVGFSLLYPLVNETLELTSYTVSASYFPFKKAGAYFSVGTGYSKGKVEHSLLGRTDHTDATGYVILGAIGYEWRLGNTFALGLRLAVDHHQFDEQLINEASSYLVGLQLRWYLE